MIYGMNKNSKVLRNSLSLIFHDFIAYVTSRLDKLSYHNMKWLCLRVQSFAMYAIFKYEILWYFFYI